MSQTLVAHFHELAQADRTVDDLVTSGIAPDAIRVVLHDGTRHRAVADAPTGNWSPALGTALGAATGIALVLLVRALRGHGLGLSLRGLAAVLLVTALGAIVGGLLGAIRSSRRAVRMTHGADRGALVAVESDATDLGWVERVFERDGADRIEVHAPGWSPPGLLAQDAGLAAATGERVDHGPGVRRRRFTSPDGETIEVTEPPALDLPVGAVRLSES